MYRHLGLRRRVRLAAAVVKKLAKLRVYKRKLLWTRLNSRNSGGGHVSHSGRSGMGGGERRGKRQVYMETFSRRSTETAELV